MNSFAAFLASFAFLAFLAFPLRGAEEHTQKSRRTAEHLLLRGIEYYDKQEMEQAMESFMEVLRMGATPEETALAREYLDRITLRMSGQKVENVHGFKISSMTPMGQLSAQPTPVREPILPKKETAAPKPQGPPPETPQEYLNRRLSAKRKEILKLWKNKEGFSIVQRGDDKILSVTMAHKIIFSKGTHFVAEAGEMLNRLVEAAYYHPRHLIRIYPAWTGSRPSIEDLQRATVLGSFLTGRGLASQRIKVELERSPHKGRFDELLYSRELESVLAQREGNITVVFQEIAQSQEAQAFFANYIPPEAAGLDKPLLSLGLSRSRLDTGKAEGIIVEFYVNSAGAPIANWRLALLNASGSSVMTKEGSGPVLESVYFDGRRGLGPHYDFLPEGRYTFEAEAIHQAGGKAKVVQNIEILGGGMKPVSAQVWEEKKTEKQEERKKEEKIPDNSGKKIVKKPQQEKKGDPPKANVRTNAAKAQQPAADAKPDTEEQYSATFRLTFRANESSLAASQHAVLKQVAAAAKTYPGQRFSLIGLASPDETDAANLADKRVREVARLLSSRYGVASNRLRLESGVGMKGQREVEVSIEE